MFIKNKGNKGITLIALVVTIIVLLILAGISIQMLVGEGGILTNAREASETTKDANEDEQVKLAVAEALVNGTGTLSTSNVRKALENEFGTDKVTDTTFTGDGPWTFTGERKTYIIETTGKITSGETTTPSVEGKLATEVLKINPDAEEDYKKSPYVKYGDLTCRVLYNDGYEDGSHGLQLVSAECTKKVKLGVNNWENYLASRDSYNNALETLYQEVQRNLLSGGVADDVRCLGSKASLVGGKFQKSLDKVMYECEDSEFEDMQSNTFCAGDNYYLDDVSTDGGIIKTLGLTAKEDCWLASRNVEEIGSELMFSVRILRSNGGVDSADLLCYLHLQSGNISGDGYSRSEELGVRPVFLLSTDASIKSGNGTSEQPYELELRLIEKVFTIK